MAGKYDKSADIVPFRPDIEGGAKVLRSPGARTSRMQRIQLEREHLYLQIKTLWHMGEIYGLLSRDWSVPTQEELDKAMRAGVDLPSHRARIAEYKAKMEGHFKMLNKVLPDQASFQVDAQVETTDKNTTPNIRIVAFRDDPAQIQAKQQQAKQQQAKQQQAGQARQSQKRMERPGNGVQEPEKERHGKAPAKTIQAHTEPRVTTRPPAGPSTLNPEHVPLDIKDMPWLK